jgi:hypothetical protein
MAWDSEVPKLGDTIEIIPSGEPHKILATIAETILRQADAYRERAAASRESAEREEAMALSLKQEAAKFLAAAHTVREHP